MFCTLAHEHLARVDKLACGCDCVHGGLSLA